jgi:uncharacterized protein
MLFIIFILNLVIGGLIGISGISGFLLPLIYVGVLNIPLRDSLALSFISFLVGGTIGTYSYWKSGNINLKFAKLISIGSILGAWIGVQLNVLLPIDIVKVILYIVVLLSGISILFKKDANQQGEEESKTSEILENRLIVIIIGFLTAAICSLTGAGGPILVVPLLTCLGMNVRVAVGVGLFNSIIIALPSSFGYLMHSDFKSIVVLVATSAFAHCIGVLCGAKFSTKVNLKLLRKFISFISISSALYMIIGLII